MVSCLARLTLDPRATGRVGPLGHVGPRSKLRSEVASRDVATGPLIRATPPLGSVSGPGLIGRPWSPLPITGEPRLAA